MRIKSSIVLFFSSLLAFFQGFAQNYYQTDVLIIGGGASGTTAAIQAAKMGVKVLVIEETEWLGGMLTSAGVSAIDGNHNMPSGLWGEFRQHLYDYYGGPKAVETGWVSNTLFEPSFGNKTLKKMAQLPNLTVWYKSKLSNVSRAGKLWTATINVEGKPQAVGAKILIDATELGDVMAKLKVPYRLGMDSRYDTGESFAPEKANNIIQDLTYVVILKDFGTKANKTIKKPEGYDPNEFDCCCDVQDPASHDSTPKIDCSQMITYGKLPNGKYMINWPKCGNDIYLNIVEMNEAERKEALKKAKLHSLRFIYHLQTKLGFKNLGIADDEFPTADGLPMIAYYRESRRLDGKVTLTVNDVASPYTQKTALYRTGIAVGDYTIDHHHLKNPDAPKIDFVKIKVPSYNIPLGALVPKNTEGLIVAEKSISVTNIVAGASRLQPVVLGVGQAAGALAATAVISNTDPSQINIREVQNALLESNAYLMPFIDVKPNDASFKVIQRIGATGILKGTGLSYKWANQTWFYPELPVSEWDLVNGLKSFYPAFAELNPSGNLVNATFLASAVKEIGKKDVKATQITDFLKQQGFGNLTAESKLNRKMVAHVLDHFLNPFQQRIDFNGIPTVSE
ncbi:FAD-dependent oxidoreductase [Nubsella zeaxanthinifaciens]|uniref:FAD-dependent oxidoreductase n=1 Tax=Nubsella zeaxanthinifaciens TaxID=392412 RepID=UPI000DE38E11|nr:FAD-dependent oxidoreductase [Nubsella zeaxanthinifaciens]